MQNYGQSFVGSLVIERVDKLPIWSISDIGRLLYDTDTDQYYIAGINCNTGINGWIPIGLNKNVIKSWMVDWDINITNEYGKVSAKDLPVLYKTKPSDVQTVINIFDDSIEKLKTAELIADESIKCRHLKTQGSEAVSAACIPIINLKSLFPVIDNPVITIEEALTYLITRTADTIKLEDSTKYERDDIFGSCLSFVSPAKTVQDALELLEQYLCRLTATDIPCTYEGCSCKTNVQFVLDALFRLYSQCKLCDLSDVPPVTVANQYLKFNGTELEWTDLLALNVQCQYPGNSPGFNVQQAIWDLESKYVTLANSIGTIIFKAKDVEYLNNKYPTVNNVQSMLDYIVTDFYSIQNPPTSRNIKCDPIGSPSNTNIHLALAYLDSQVNTLLSTLPCEVDIEDINYTTPDSINTNLKNTLDYILAFIDCCLTNNVVTFNKFTG